MAEGTNRILADLENLNIRDDFPTESSTLQTGGKAHNFSKLRTNSLDKDSYKSSTKERSALHLRNSNDTTEFYNDKEFIGRISLNSSKHDVESDSFGNSFRAPFSPDTQRSGICERIISEGEEVADLIVGSYRALDVFQSYYDEWAVYRVQSQGLLEQLAETIASSSKKTEIIKNIIGGIERVEGGIQVVRNPVLSLGAKLAALFSTVILKMFGPNYNKKDVEKKEFEIRQVFQKDIDTSSTVYIYGVQCALQFEETCNAIRDFRLKIQEQNWNAVIEDEFVLEFLNEISDYNPSNVSVFYKVFRRAYEKLIANSKSRESRALTKVFEVMPDAINVINLLNWRFDSDGFDNSITQRAWDELFEIFINSEAYSLEDFLGKIQNCLFFLEKERKILEGSILSLLNEKN